MKTIFLLVSLIFSLTATAAPFQLKGSYFFKNGEKNPVSFNLRWVEKEGRITGFYSDDRFTERAAVTGVATDNGRTFEIILPQESAGLKSFSLLTSAVTASDTGKHIPLQLVTRDMKGTPLTTAKFQAQFTEITPRAEGTQAQEARPCTDGFGQMAGYCGRYGGMVSEEFDSGRLCDFLTTKNVRLEVDNEANVIFHTDQPGERHS